METPEIGILLEKMKSEGTLRCIGRVKAFSKPLEFALLTNVGDITMLLSAVGQIEPLYVYRKVVARDGNIFIDGYIENDDYKRWKEYFGLKDSGNNIFNLAAIWDQIKSQIADLHLSKSPIDLYHEILLASPYQNDGEGTYFLSFRHNASPAKTSDKNYDKTCLAFGKEVADKLRAHNISTCWTSFSQGENKEELSRLLHTI